MGSIFSRIIAGEIPCHKIAEDEAYFAFLDINPLRKGHTLVIPKVEIDYVFDVEDSVLGGLMVFAKKIAPAIKSVEPCTRIGVVVAGLEVPHCHVHLIPMDSVADLDFSGPKVQYTNEEFAELAAEIRAAL